MRSALILLGVLSASPTFAGVLAVPLQSSCSAERVSVDSWASVQEALKGDILYMDYKRAIQRGEEALSGLPCADGVISPEVLGEVFFLMGLAAARDGQPDVGSSWFGQALAAGRDSSWDTDLGEKGRDLYEAAHGLAPNRSDWSWPAGLVVFLDGQRQDGRSVAVNAGWHIVQWRDRSGTVNGLVLQTDGSQPVLLSASADLFPPRKTAVRVLPGAVLAVGGGILMAEGYASGAKAARLHCEATTTQGYEDAVEAHGAAKTRATVGAVLLGVGAAGAVVGLVWPSGQRVSLTPQIRRPGAVFTVRIGGRR